MASAPQNTPLVRLLKASMLVLSVGLVLEIAWLGVLIPLSGEVEATDISYNVAPPAIVPMAAREAFEESVERSLFSWNRRPKVSEQPVSEEGLPSKWVLTGVVNTGRATYAIFSDSSGEQRLRLEEGMYLEKWKLESITPEQVTLSDGDETEEFYLRETGQPQKTLNQNTRKSDEEEDTD
ncbi:hypothetical protein [Porticoccus sp.]